MQKYLQQSVQHQVVYLYFYNDSCKLLCLHLWFVIVKNKLTIFFYGLYSYLP